MADPHIIQGLVKHVHETEAAHLRFGDRYDPVTTPFMPYQPADFVAILWECMEVLNIQPRSFLHQPPTFLDVGCGPGTKMQIAQVLFGLQAYGIEIDKDMAAAAEKLFPQRVTAKDALDCSGYDQYDLIWLYRPFRDRDKELALEQKIIDAMKPGAIIAGGSWDTNIPDLDDFVPVVDDTLEDPSGSGAQIWRGAWQRVRTR